MKGKIFNKFLQRPRFRVDCSDLNPELATQIIEKEIDLEKQVSLESIQDLIQLYTKAIEHYEAQENPKFLDFQEKLQKLLVKPQVLSILSPKPLSPQSTPISPKCASSSTSVDEHRKKLSSQFNSAISNNPINVIDSHSSISKETSENLISVIKSQENDLESKLQARKTRRSRRYTSDSHINSSYFKCDMSGVESDLNSSTRSSLFGLQDLKSSERYEKYEKMLDEIMERNLGEKALKIMEIKMKYEREIEKLDGSGGVFEMVVQEMKNNMQKEFEEISMFYDLKRKEEIQKLREELSN